MGRPHSCRDCTLGKGIFSSLTLIAYISLASSWTKNIQYEAHEEISNSFLLYQKKKKKKLLYNPHLHVFFNSKSSWLLFAYTVNLPAFSLTRTFTWRRKESHIHFLKTALGYLTRELSLGTTAYGDLHLRYICLTFHTLKTCITLMPI